MVVYHKYFAVQTRKRRFWSLARRTKTWYHSRV